MVALHAGRISQARRTIAFTAGIMLLWNPRLLMDDLGFQLSFLSVLGILEVSPHIEPLLKRIPNTLALRESIALTLGSQFTAAPWIAYKLGNISLVALPANLLATPFIPLAMLTSFLAVVLSPLGLGLPAAFVGNVPLTAIILAAKSTAALPYAAIDDMTIPLPFLIGYYTLLVAILWKQKPRTLPIRQDAGSRAYNAISSSVQPSGQLRASK